MQFYGWLFIGFILGYVVCDLLNPNSKIVYHIGKIKQRRRNSEGDDNIDVDIKPEEKFNRLQRWRNRRKVKKLLKKKRV